MSRPELVAPPELFYDSSESQSYTRNTRVQQIQAEMTLRALELLDLPPSQLVLDIGCGSGLSSDILSEHGHQWVGMDISADMLGIALDRQCDGDLMLSDMGGGVPFRAGTFDAAISISALQWLCNADSTGASPKRRMQRFFNTLYASLKRGGKAACQFYPADQSQTDALLHAAKVAGFGGGMIIDHAESKKHRKYYLVLTAGDGVELNLAGVQQEEGQHAKRADKRKRESKAEFIQRKKESMRRRGKTVAKDSKFTGRRRRPQF